MKTWSEGEGQNMLASRSANLGYPLQKRGSKNANLSVVGSKKAFLVEHLCLDGH
jgi:hypothetical protein